MPPRKTAQKTSVPDSEPVHPLDPGPDSEPVHTPDPGPDSEPVHTPDPGPETNDTAREPAPEDHIHVPEIQGAGDGAGDGDGDGDGDDGGACGEVDGVAGDPEPNKASEPVEELKHDLEVIRAGVSGLVIFSKDLDSRVKSTLKLLAKVAKKKGSGNKPSDGPKRETNLTKKLKVSPEMAEFVGVDDGEACRTEIVKRISDYSKKKILKLETDRRIIVLDDVLAKLMKLEKGANVRFCDVQKYIKHHFIA